jgi:hypothetical protein
MNFELKETTDYSLFKLTQNREIKSKHVKEKLKSIEEDGLQLPIVVNGRYEIVDGQHRFAALTQLKRPITYLVSYAWKDEYDTAVINNTQRSWNTENWAEFRSQKNIRIREALSLARNYSDITGGKMTVTTALEMISATGTSILRDIKSGFYDYDNDEGNEVYQALEIIASYPNKMKNPFNQKMTRSIKALFNHYSYVNKKAIERMAANNYIKVFNNETDMFDYIKDMYNEALKKK